MEADCIFCRIVRGEIPSDKVYEDSDFLVFKDLQPVAPVHVLIVPKQHIQDMEHFAAADPEGRLAAGLMRLIPRLTAKLGVATKGYRLINNCGEEGGQTVPHFHLHLIGGEPLGDRLR